MAQTMMHLLIAEKIYKSGMIPISSYGDFLLGSIAPDAVHVREQYTRKMKDISHYSFNNESQVEFFNTFIDEYKTSDNIDFVVGYLVHLLSDMIWYHSVRVPFKSKFSKKPSVDMNMNEVYYFDCEQIEQQLFFDNEAYQIVKSLDNGKAYSLEGMIEKREVYIWKDKLLAQYNAREQTLMNLRYISEQQIRDYIAECSDKCIEYLRNVPCFQK